MLNVFHKIISICYSFCLLIKLYKQKKKLKKIRQIFSDDM